MSNLRKVEVWIGERLDAQDAVKRLVTDTSNTRSPEEAPYPRLVFALLPGQQVNTTLCGAVESIRAQYEVTILGRNGGYEALSSVEDAIHTLLDNAIVKKTPTCPAFDSRLVSEIRRSRPTAAEGDTLYEVGGLFQFFVTP